LVLYLINSTAQTADGYTATDFFLISLVIVNIQAYIPKGPLKEFVHTIHFIHGKESGTGVAFPRMEQVIIINLGTRFSSSDVYAPEASAVVRETSSTVWINGKQDDPFLLGNSGVTAMYAIGLKLGMVPYFADLPAIETNNLAVGAENWTSCGIFELQQQLQECESVAAGFLLIESYLLNLLRGRDFSHLERVKWLSRAMHTQTVADICRSLGMTRKRLRSEAQHYFGGSVKNIQGIIRLNRTLTTIAAATTGIGPAANEGNGSLSSLHEYFDQAHFIHDFKARTGITPLQYRRLCRQFPFIAHTPNFIALPRETFLQFISGQGR
jgi:AraC-like DNA-binding protein